MQLHQPRGVRAPLGRLVAAALWLLGQGAAIQAGAQVVMDGSLGPAGPLAGPDYLIDAELGQLQGENLFHSFQQLDVQTGESATFTGPDVVENIVGRVTGGAPSTIDGLLASEIPGAGLFLLNPMGVLFGENASLDVDGSFHVSTAGYLRFADGSQFFADLGPGSALSLAPPAAFGFFEAPTGITVEGDGVEDTFDLEVFEGESISLVGGDLRVEGASLVAPSGRVNLVSVASAGEVALPATPDEPGFEVDDFVALGDLELLDRSTVSASGDGGGTVVIRGGLVFVDDTVIESDTNGDLDGAPIAVDVRAEELVVAGRLDAEGPGIFSQVRGAGAAGDISIVADRVEFLDNVFVTTDVDEGTGQGGDFRIETDFLLATGGSQIGAGTFADGDGGSLEIVADEVVFTGTDATEGPSGIFVSSDLDFEGNPPNGDAGSLTLTANSLEVLDGANINGRIEGFGEAAAMEIRSGSILVAGNGQILTTAEGEANSPGGDLIVAADRIVLDDGGEIGAENRSNDPGARGGNIEITAGDISLTRAGLIAADTFGPGDGGSVTIRSDRLTVDGEDFDGNAAIIVESDADAAGNAGSLDIDAGEITLLAGGVISGSTFGSGDGGPVTIRADRITITGESAEASAILVAAEEGSTGNASTLEIDVGRLEVRDGGLVGAESFGPGIGGDITIRAEGVVLDDGSIQANSFSSADDAGRSGSIILVVGDKLDLENGSLISVETERADAGGIEVQARTWVLLRDQSGIATSVADGQGNGGNIRIDPEFVILDEGFIVANAVQGAGGNIDIVTGTFLPSADSFVSASSELGVDGIIEVRSPDTSVIQGTIQLPQTVLRADALFKERCSEQAQTEESSFRVEGAGGLPVQPGNLLPAGSGLAPSRPSTDRHTPEAPRLAAIRSDLTRVGCSR